MVQPGSKIESLEALRGLLALWVLVAHVTSRIISDAAIAQAHSRAALEPLIPVYVFMVLSGFVIWDLLQRRTESWGAFLARRFFRIFPLYAVVLAVSALMTDFQLRTLENLFWRNMHVVDGIKIHQETLAHFWPHLWAHIFMVHGVIADRWLADSNFTFLSQGWSISLEWQFYIVAPALFALAAARRAAVTALTLVALGAAWLLAYPGVGFLPNQFAWFALGIASWHAWRTPDWFARIPARAHDAMLLGMAVTVYLLVPQPLPVLVWLVAMDAALAVKTGLATPVTAIVNRLLQTSALQWLGGISYSIYLVHIPILYVVFHAITRLDPHLFGWEFLALALPATLGLTLMVAAVTHRLIEVPGMVLGKRLVRALPRKDAERPQAA